jgi:cobaltochelatase CobN
VENIPSNVTALETLMITLGKNVATWAPGMLDEMLENENLILYPVSDYLEWFSQLDEMTQLQVKEGPVAYIGELCKRAVELDYTSDMTSRLKPGILVCFPFSPDEDYDVAQPLLENIASTLKNYINSHSSTDYNAFLLYKQQFLSLDINGTTGWGKHRVILWL